MYGQTNQTADFYELNRDETVYQCRLPNNKEVWKF